MNRDTGKVERIGEAKRFVQQRPQVLGLGCGLTGGHFVSGPFDSGIARRYHGIETAKADGSRMVAVEVSAVAQCLADADHRLVACDDAYLELLGRERSDVIGCHVLDLTYAPDRPINAIMLRSLASAGQAFSITKRYVRGDGGLVWVTNGVGSIRDGTGRAIVCATSRAVESPVNRDALVRNVAAARRLCAAFLAGKQLFGADLVSAPAAELLLELYVAEIEGRSLSVDELASAIELGRASTRRWLAILKARGLIEVEGHAPVPAEVSFRISQRCELALEGLIAYTGL